MNLTMMSIAIGALGICLHAEAQTIDGILEPSQNVLVKTVIDGVVKDVPLSEGMIVEPATVIVRLDGAEQEAKVKLAKAIANATANLRSAEHRFRTASRKLNELKSAREKGAATRWEVLDAQAASSLAKLEVQSAKEEMDANQQRLALETELLQRYHFVAPFSGTLAEVFVAPGQSVSRGENVARIVNTEVLEIEAYVEADHFQLLEIGRVYKGEIVAPFIRTFKASLIHIDPVFDAATGTIRVVFKVENDDDLPAGVNTRISLSEEISLSWSSEN